MCRFRITNHKLPIEPGRRNNIGRSNRLCIGCNTNDIGDEFHYIFECKNRKCCISNIYFRNANVIQFRKLIYDIANKLLLTFVNSLNYSTKVYVIQAKIIFKLHLFLTVNIVHICLLYTYVDINEPLVYTNKC